MAYVMLLSGAEEERLKRKLIICRRLLRSTSCPMDLPQKEFQGHFRLKKSNFRTLCDDLRPILKATQRNTAILPEIKVLAALNFFAQGCYQKSVGAHFILGLSQPAVSQSLHEVTEAMNNPAILRKYIRFPRTPEEREAISTRFLEVNGVPGVLGCLDGTHVAIVKPNRDEEVYFNRKRYHSINAMMICDADLRILHVDAQFGGHCHDSHILNNSPIRRVMEDLHTAGESYWLLGDSGYAQRPWLMTPILNANPESPEGHYTKKHVETRCVVERNFGVLKTRWRSLLAHRTMHYAPIKAGKMINACVVLHNLENDHRILIDQEAMALDRARQPGRLPVHPDDDVYPHGQRPALVQRLWQHR